MTDHPVDVGFLVTRTAERARAFLAQELDTPILASRFALRDVNRLDLRELTSIVVVGGPVDMIVAFSFDGALLEQLFKIYVADLTIENHEREIYIGETAGDIINTVIGNLTADINPGGRAITFSPPVIVTGARSLLRYKEARFYTVSLETAYGALVVNIIGPKQLFDKYLNYLP